MVLIVLLLISACVADAVGALGCELVEKFTRTRAPIVRARRYHFN